MPVRFFRKNRRVKQNPQHDRFAREPWLYSRKATASERADQGKREKHWCKQGDCHFAADVYISPGATVNPKHLVVGQSTSVGSEAQIGYDLELGARCTVNAGAIVRGKIRIGNDVRIASGAQILGFNHSSDNLTKPIHQQPIIRKGIVIGDDVWIGGNAIVLDGLNIGSHAVVGAGTVVTKDVPSWSVVAGNPARIIRSRKFGRLGTDRELVSSWRYFNDVVAAEITDVLNSYRIDEGFVDSPGGSLKIRAWADAVELASMTGTKTPGYETEQLVKILHSFQDPVTGLVPGPYSEDKLSLGGKYTELMECRHSAYGVMSIGYALECLGSHLQYPVVVAARLNAERLLPHLSNMPWKTKAWNSGAWIDHFASACYFNTRYHGIDRDMTDLAGWLLLHVNKKSGMWGQPYPETDWLQPVNCFYRLTRGAHAQWDWPLPYPVTSIDTLIDHAHNQDHFAPEQTTACKVLDIIHPLWLCLKQSSHRRAEAEAIAQFWLRDTINRWHKKHGLSFNTCPSAKPGLQGTEMWLSIAWFCADLLGITSDADLYKPCGVHRPEVATKQIATHD